MPGSEPEHVGPSAAAATELQPQVQPAQQGRTKQQLETRPTPEEQAVAAAEVEQQPQEVAEAEQAKPEAHEAAAQSPPPRIPIHVSSIGTPTRSSNGSPLRRDRGQGHMLMQSPQLSPISSRVLSEAPALQAKCSAVAWLPFF